ncbi:hypothetical protein BDA99DRAFT_566140 [Phascolomyces articulosus]|uniref:Myb-like domain-containing protein n=1 Tax=Phascolomyces articulosus TaxID=60185 RepID=A0AAD5P8S6_9FUNG|nr:hypothetical protein BDA99DRAFT_566140 [Phascolomyces articulosus]
MSWSNKDKTILITIKLNNPNASWDAISMVLNEDHSPNACRRFFKRLQLEEKKEGDDNTFSSGDDFSSKRKSLIPSSSAFSERQREDAKLHEKTKQDKDDITSPLLPTSSTTHRSFVAETKTKSNGHPIMSTGRNKHWSEDEVDELLRLRIKNKLSWVDIGIELGRSAESCRSKYQRL